MKNENLPKKDYTGDSIKVLTGLDPVRKRPGMYIGDTDDGTGLHHMVTEVVDNSIDEAGEGHCNQISVTIHANGSVSVLDNGRGIPTELIEVADGERLSAATVIMTTLHAGGKFDEESYTASGGLHGVGVSVVNALSENLTMKIFRNGSVFQQEFKNGDPVNKLENIGETEKRGTLICFKPSAEIFSETKFTFSTIHERLRELSYLNPGIQIVLTDERGDEIDHKVLKHDGGIKEFVRDLNHLHTPLNEKIIYVEGERDSVEVKVAMQWSGNRYQEKTRCYTNNIYQSDGGTHQTGFRKSVTKTLTSYIDQEKLAKKIKIEGNDTREGLTAILLVTIHEPKFSSQTKDKLVSSDVEGAVSSVVSEGLHRFLEENPKVARVICNKVIHAATARLRAQQEREKIRKSPFESTSLPGKLADCQEKDPAKSELFLVEGESAGGSAKQARDRRFQAVLPLKGKILNVEKATIDKIHSSEEIQSLVAAIGTGIDNEFNIEKLRYHRVIIMTDADIDGSHIRTLLMTFFYRKMRQLIEENHLYIAQPPLYKAKYQKSEKYLNDDRELNDFILDAPVKKFRIELDDNLNQPTIEGVNLVNLCKLKISAKAAAEKLAQKLDSTLIEKLKLMPCLEESNLTDKDFLNSYAERLSSYLSADSNGRVGFTVEVKGQESQNSSVHYRIEVVKTGIGEHNVSRLDEELVTSRSYRNFADSSAELYRYQSASIGIKKGKELRQMNNLDEALDFILEEARNGITIQRYKGLGEMNADQLRETTMEVGERVLRKVKIGDGSKTDDTFTILMGDQVAARREFIETEALHVQNLDYN